MGCNQAQQIFPGPGVWCLFDLSGEVKIIPADDGVPDQSVTALCDLLFFLFGLGVFAWVQRDKQLRADHAEAHQT